MKNVKFLGSVLIAPWICLAVGNPSGEVARADEDRSACCRNDASEISRLQGNAERYFTQFKPREAAAELKKILTLDPRNLEALAKLARAHIDIGDMIPESSENWQEKRIQEYQLAEEYARKAVRVDPNSTWAHFYLAASLGNAALLSPVTKQIDLAGEIRWAVEKAIALDPQNGFAYHVYGVWHRKMAEIGNASRAFATVLLGRTVPSGNLDKSIEYLNKAVTLNPTVIVSRLELAQSYIAAGNSRLARASLKSIQQLPIRFSDDARHKQKAEQLLQEIQ